MSNQHTIFRVIIPGKIPVQRTQQIINAIVDICSGFTTGNTIIKNSVFPTFSAYLVKIFVAPQIPPLLFP